MTAAEPRTITTVWELRTYDVWGNAEDGYEVNDSYVIDRAYELELAVEVANAGTAQEFLHASPTDDQIRRALCDFRGDFSTDGDDTHIYVTLDDGYPVGELCCMSHESLSPIRGSSEPDAGDEPEEWHMGELYHDWTSPCGKYHVQTRYDHSENGRTYLAYSLWCEKALVFRGNDFGCSPLHADDSWAALASLLHFLSLRPGDTDAEYFRDYTPAQLAFAQEYGEELGALASDMETWDAD